MDLYGGIQRDLDQRRVLGLARYGIGIERVEKDWLLEAYEEALDTVIYLRRALDERARV